MQRAVLSCLIVATVTLMAAPALAVEDIEWTSTTPASGEVEGDELRIDGPGTHQVVTLTEPDIRGDSYAVEGTVRYEDVAGTAYLEMWSFFADGGAFFSRTLDVEGSMAALEGDSDARRFSLPFLLNGASGPERIEINLVLPEGGTVWIGALELQGFGPSTDWWTERQAAAIGATSGILAGLSGAAIGFLGGRARNRRLVEGLLVGGVTVGGGLLVVGLAGLVAHQPRHVWYPVGLVGIILVVVYGMLIPTMRRNYAAAELHRITALDA
ncbi:MAG: hypothetical protein OEO77_02770 [Acidimicrobiia bacterium]|nr:hypothetical protein [Acidimicrobiia bacterium]